MCTVVVDVAESWVRLLAVRDEDPRRDWDPLGEWWADAQPGVLGVRDRRAGGAWLALDPQRGCLAVMLNRADLLDVPDSELESRGTIVLSSVAGRSPQRAPRTHGFNLIEVNGTEARVVTWDGRELRSTPLPDGTHMVAHDGVDDPATPRIARWLPEFRAHRPQGGREWWHEWIDVLAQSTSLEPTDDRAIIRDNRPFGFPTQSLLYCVASVSAAGAEARYSELPEPARWTAPDAAPER